MGFFVKYYGIRGSTPTSGPEVNKYGGNTTCIYLKVDGEHIIIDAGTGIRLLGQDLIKQEFGHEGGYAHLFFTHTHWDHIQGFPFFAPAYMPMNRFDIYGEVKTIPTINENGEENLESWSIKRALMHQQHFMYFPVPTQKMAGEFDFHDITSGINLQRQAFTMKSLSMQHPNSALGFRFDWHDRSFSFCSDVEHTPYMMEKIIEFAKGSDILAYDAQFTPEEYEAGKQGWGHSTYEKGAEICDRAGIGELHLVHHDPTRSDAKAVKLENTARRALQKTLMVPEGFEFSW